MLRPPGKPVHFSVMSVTLEISADLEPLLEAEAVKAGTDPSTLAQQLLRDSLTGKRPPGVPCTPAEEEELFKAINRGPTQPEMERYEGLIRKRQDEDLSAEEFDELRQFTNRMEELGSERLTGLARLAESRRVRLDQLMADLEIQPPDVL